MRQTNTQNKLEGKSQETRQQFRKQQIQQLVRQQRLQHTKQFQHQEQQEFQKFNISLSPSTLACSLELAHQYSTSQSHCFQMLPHCHLFLQSLKNSPPSEPSSLLLLQILCNLSIYQQFQIPGDKQSSSLFLSLLPLYPDQTLQLLDNLTRNSNNFTEMFVYLIQDGFVEKLRELETRPAVMAKGYGVLCGVLQCRPMMPVEQIKKVLELLGKIEGQQERMRLVEVMGGFVMMRPIEGLGEVLFYYLIPKCQQFYEEFTYQCLMFLNYIILHHHLVKKIPNSLTHAVSQSAIKGRFKEDAINTLNLLSEGLQKSSAELFGEEYFAVLLNEYWVDNLSIKSSVIKALDFVARDRNSYKLYSSPVFIELILERLSERIMKKQILETLQILASIIQHMQNSQDQARFISPFKIAVEQLSNYPHQISQITELCHFLLEHEEC